MALSIPPPAPLTTAGSLPAPQDEPPGDALASVTVRLYVDEAGRALLDDPAHKLHPILRQHDAVLVSQLGSFEAFLADPAQAASPLGRWTARTLANPEKRAKHRLAIAVRIGGAEVYDRAVADALEDDLRPLVEDGTLLRLSRHDTNPAANLPIPAEYRS